MTTFFPRTLFPFLLLCLALVAGCGGGQTTVAGPNLPPVSLAPVTTAVPAGSQFTASQQVALTATGGAAIYYTTDGSTPSTGSTRYSGPITISSSTDLKFFAVDGKGNQESVKTEHYTLVLPISLRISAAGLAQSVSGIKVTLTLPAGISVATSVGSVAAGTVAASGVTQGNAAVMPESVSWSAGSRTLGFILYSTDPAGFGAGEFANVTCLISGAVPAPNSFSAVLEPVDLLGNTLAPTPASFQVIP